MHGVTAAAWVGDLEGPCWVVARPHDSVMIGLRGRAGSTGGDGIALSTWVCVLPVVACGRGHKCGVIDGVLLVCAYGV